MRCHSCSSLISMSEALYDGQGSPVCEGCEQLETELDAAAPRSTHLQFVGTALIGLSIAVIVFGIWSGVLPILPFFFLGLGVFFKVHRPASERWTALA